MDIDVKLPVSTASRIVPLWLLVFFTGWFIMQTEIAGARALTPYFGNSIFVWGSVIAVFLLTLAVGYGLGGRLTRRYQSHWAPASLLVAAGALVGLTVLYQDGLCYSLAATGIDVRWGALLASTALYAAPMILAGTVAPYSVHLATAVRAEVGSRAGTLYAISTIGSFIGSLMTAFALIPSYSLQQVVLGGGIMAAAAAIVAVVGLSVGGRASVALSLVFAALVVSAAVYSPRKLVSSQHQVYLRSMIGEKLSDADPSTLDDRISQGQNEALAELRRHADAGEVVLFSRETAYHRVEVTQSGPIRVLTFGEAGFKMPQTMMNLNDIRAQISEYTGIMMAPILYKQDVKRALIIGLGGGDVARALETCYPEIVMDVVEIDPVVVRLAQDYFFWKPGKNVTVYTMDGRSFVNMSVMAGREQYDWILLDAFDNDFVPFHMTTVEFYSVLQRALAPDGVLAINTHIDHNLYSYLARTVNAAFGQLDGYMAHRAGNVILVAQKGAEGPMTPDRALEARKRADLPAGARVDLKYVTSCLLARPNWDPEGDILTDLWAPVEGLLSMR